MSDFSFVPLRPFFYAALAKRWKVQFRQGFVYFNNNVDSKRHMIIRAVILYNEINSGQIMKNTIYIYMLLLSVFSFFIIVHCLFHYIIQQFTLIYVVFLINVVKICKPLSKLDLPTLRKGSTKERTQRSK